MTTTKRDLIFKILVETDKVRVFHNVPPLSETDRFDCFDDLCTFTKKELSDLFTALCESYSSEVKLKKMFDSHFSS